ncbi:MAG: NAD(P)-dependent oxidoreductase, partial [Pseudomonadota bacterium]
MRVSSKPSSGIWITPGGGSLSGPAFRKRVRPNGGSMRLFVTGTKGQVVSALIERGRQTTADIIALGRPNIDLTDPTSLREAIFPMAPDAIVSAAAFTAVDLAEDETREAFAANASGAGHLAHVARRLDVPIIHLSTDYVFDGRNPAGYREDDPVGPINAYGKSKLAGEYFVQANTLNHAILRTSWVYSPFGANFLKTMLRFAEERDVLSVVDDQRGAPTSAFDIADGILAIAANMLERPKEKALRGTF